MLLNGRRFRLLAACLLAVCLVPLPGRSQVVAPSSASIAFGQGVYRGRPVTFQVVDGLAIIEGDIILGRVEELTSSQKPLQEIQAKKQGLGDKKGAVARGSGVKAGLAVIAARPERLGDFLAGPMPRLRGWRPLPSRGAKSFSRQGR